MEETNGVKNEDYYDASPVFVLEDEVCFHCWPSCPYSKK